jgi:hypothetical protein
MRMLVSVLIVSVLLAAVPLQGGPLLKSRVSADANWVVHADYDLFNKTIIGQLIRAELASLDLEEKLQDFKTIFSFHPLDDVRNVTLYGSGHDREKAVVLIEGDFDQETLVGLVRMNAEYEEIKYGDVVVHSWVDENRKYPGKAGQRMYGCVPKDHLVVMGAGLEALKQAVDVLNGSAANAADGVFDQGALETTGAFFQVAANGVGDVAEHQHHAALLKQTDKLGVAIGEVEGMFYADLILSAKSQETAQNLKKVLEGMIAFLTLAGSERPVLAELARKLELSTADNVVAIHFESDSAAIISFLKEQWEAKKQQ